MKHLLSAMTLLALLVLGGRDSRAQAYDPYWDALQYQQYLQYQEYLASLQAYDPYYELHAMHYQLYLPSYSYQLYQPCCYYGQFANPGYLTQRGPLPRPFIGSRSGSLPLAVAPLPPAVGPLPRAVAPLPRAVGRR
jgi:hypothetical protein